MNIIEVVCTVVTSDSDNTAILENLPIDMIIPNQYQPRKKFSEDELVELSSSIEVLGVLQPILVRAVENGDYELIAGERRWRAARRAGLDKIPAVVRDVDDVVSLEQAIVENLHRVNLNPIEEAYAYRQLIDDFDFNHSQVAEKVSKSRSVVANTLRLLKLPLKVQTYLQSGRISAGHARAILMVEDSVGQIKLSQLIVEKSLTVRDAEREAARMLDTRTTEPTKTSKSKDKSVAILEVEQNLSNELDTRVSIENFNSRFIIEIECADIVDLGRIYELIKTK